MAQLTSPITSTDRGPGRNRLFRVVAGALLSLMLAAGGLGASPASADWWDDCDDITIPCTTH